MPTNSVVRSRSFIICARLILHLSVGGRGRGGETSGSEFGAIIKIDTW